VKLESVFSKEDEKVTTEENEFLETLLKGPCLVFVIE